ncbi:hypothetical protein [Oceanirhabdus seepicola]|uniref:Uncharacterized protein n=1 Tax=Oceanirhabdus seepicola TaxID=2828781 RepID=A0A9J6P6R1_9CLOT|nr:hypothetical protein [Oceanirhabdus seepicola]MCM1992538.1 hypothetical protein [Oceanirhabdus seepicola]
MKYELINILNDNENIELKKLADNIAQQLEKEGIEELQITINERLWQPTNCEEITFDFVLNKRHKMGLLYDDMILEDVKVLVDTLIHHMGN